MRTYEKLRQSKCRTIINHRYLEIKRLGIKSNFSGHVACPALILLGIPEEEREEFIAEHDGELMSNLRMI
ncbi:DUF3102 domain-containing protein [Desulfosporosinus fructosivorans]|nr:DUF3102 domain-containing protein [Desulfosporosinus fructosivorans]